MRRDECPVCGVWAWLHGDYGERLCGQCVDWMYRLPDKYQDRELFPIESEIACGESAL